MSPEPNSSQIRPEMKNFDISKDNVKPDIKDDVITRQWRQFWKFFLGYFGENLTNSISTPNFILIELETTKLGGGGGGGALPHTVVFFK